MNSQQVVQYYLRMKQWGKSGRRNKRLQPQQQFLRSPLLMDQQKLIWKRRINTAMWFAAGMSIGILIARWV